MKALQAFLLAFALPSALLAQVEICNNGLDDNGDGLIDLNDPECPCSTSVIGSGVESYIRNHSFEERGCCPFGFVSMFSPPWLDCATGWHQATGATSDYFNECGYSPVGFNLPPPDGDGAVGFYAGPGYYEYVGTCLTYPLPSNPLLAGVTYTLSMWISTAITNGTHSQTLAQASYVAPFSEQLPLALFGYANACVEFPINTLDCIGYLPGWNELGRVDVQPAWEWTRVSITFTPTQDIHTIMIGGACDTPASLGGGTVYNPNTGETYNGLPYFLVDDLMLTIASDQLVLPVSTAGSLCADDATATAVPPAAVSGYQWYLDGVALAGQTNAALDISGGAYSGGTYTLAGQVDGECLMGSAYLPPATWPIPRPVWDPTAGCAPLTVQFSDSTGLGTQTVAWHLGDGTTSSDSSFSHTFSTAGSYDVSLTVLNSAGCSADTLIPGAITVYSAVNGEITATPNPVNAEAPYVQLSGGGSGGIISWWWDLGNASPSSSDEQALGAAFPTVPGSYPVLLVVASANGCVDTVQSMILVIDPGVIEMPNVFSPNNDGQNDRFLPIGYKGAPGQMEIYNRWGQVIFSSRALAQGWDGHDAPDGTYYFIVTPDEPGSATLTGHVTLLR
ncbi:MAG: gliding motility-associated C-terminal domain-containing protein [Flavobacteriales bacterium]|nr:gliding motility-associated C-terminal domain-containing protein [Flavobacteriales bacterium]MBP9080314.1 gliding motility-associated C-terminal domain-containing protein [Flavobacteriales bacterium]